MGCKLFVGGLCGGLCGLVLGFLADALLDLWVGYWCGWFMIRCFLGFLVGWRSTGFLRVVWQLVAFRLCVCFAIGDC